MNAMKDAKLRRLAEVGVLAEEVLSRRALNRKLAEERAELNALVAEMQREAADSAREMERLRAALRQATTTADALAYRAADAMHTACTIAVHDVYATSERKRPPDDLLDALLCIDVSKVLAEVKKEGT